MSPLTHTMTLALVAAEDSNFSTMGKLFPIALLIISPLAIIKIRNTFGSPRVTADTEPAPTNWHDLNACTAAITEARNRLNLSPSERWVDVPYPSNPQIDGRPAPEVLRERIIEDCLKRSNLDAEIIDDAGPVSSLLAATDDANDFKTLRCRLDGPRT